MAAELHRLYPDADCELADGFIQDALIGFVADVGNESALLGPEEVTCAADIEGAGGNFSNDRENQSRTRAATCS